jgi:hypothetical protein
VNLLQQILQFFHIHPGPSGPPGTHPAPGPEIGDGLVGIAIATVVILAFVLYPRLKLWRRSKQQ